MKAVLLLHGFLSDYHDFEPLYKHLLKRYDHVERVLFPGHGECNDLKDFDIDATFKCLYETFDNLKRDYDDIDVIGFSMGGALATYLSNVRDFNKLVLLAPANKFLNLNLPFKKFYFYLKTIFNSKEYLEMCKGTIADDKVAFKFAMKSLFPNYNYHTLSNFVKIIKKCNDNVEEIKNPTLIIWGELDQFVPEASVRYNYNLCINEKKKLIIYPDISHLMLSSKNNTKIIDDILEFLQD